jgi:cell division protease FtsH
MSMGRQQNISEATAQKIDSEVRRLVDEGYRTAREILTKNKAQFEIVAQALLEYETLSGDEIKELIAGNAIVRDDPDAPPARGSAVPIAGKKRPKKDKPDGDLEPQPQT